MDEAFESQPLSHWQTAFDGFEGVWSPFQTLDELYEDPQVIANGYLPTMTAGNGEEIQLVASPAQFDEVAVEVDPGPRARRAHRAAAHGPRLRLGPDRRHEGVRRGPVTDHKPPRAVGEREILRAAWQFQRDSLVRKVDGRVGGRRRRALVDSGTTLLWLMQHACFAERIWVRIRFAGEDALTEGDVVPSATLAEAIATYEAEWSLIDAHRRRPRPGRRRCPIPSGGEIPVTLRWIVVHLIEELARHAGHADILRELIDGDTGR